MKIQPYEKRSAETRIQHTVSGERRIQNKTPPSPLFFEEGFGVCALKQLISPVIMFFYSDVRIWLEGAAVATPSFCIKIYPPKPTGISIYKD